jgi:signal transduction histidine kinase
MIILNLAINGRDAMPSGGSVTIETFNTAIGDQPVRPEDPESGEYVGLAIRDTGEGIPEHVLARVFEPFFTTKRRGEGSGLGLAQVLGFAKQSGGGMRIETRVGEGTCVKVFLPRADVDPKA